MNFIVFWLATILGSYGVQFSITFNCFKELAKFGYKIKPDEFVGLAKSFNPDATKLRKLLPFIPIVNIFYTLIILNQYNQTKGFMFDQYNVMGCIEEMAVFEKEKYQKNPTGLNALMIALNYKMSEKSKKEIMVFELDDNSKVHFYYDKDTNEIEILKTEGRASNLTTDELESKIRNFQNNALERITEILGTKEEFLNLSNIDCDEKMSEKDYQKETLSSLKQTLINQKQEILSNQTTEKEKTKTLKK